MHISEVKAMQEEKEHLMRYEGTHPANRVNYHNPDQQGIVADAHGAELQ